MAQHSRLEIHWERSFPKDCSSDSLGEAVWRRPHLRMLLPQRQKLLRREISLDGFLRRGDDRWVVRSLTVEDNDTRIDESDGLAATWISGERDLISRAEFDPRKDVLF